MNHSLERELEKMKKLMENMTYLQMVGKEEQERMNDKAVELENQVERSKGRMVDVFRVQN